MRCPAPRARRRLESRTCGPSMTKRSRARSAHQPSRSSSASATRATSPSPTSRPTKRAPTPTAAAELATPSAVELLRKIEACAQCLSREMRRRLQYAMQTLDGCAKRLVHPAQRLRKRRANAHAAAHTGSPSRSATACIAPWPSSGAWRPRSPASTPRRCSRAATASRANAAGKVLRDASKTAQGELIFTTLAQRQACRAR